MLKSRPIGYDAQSSFTATLRRFELNGSLFPRQALILAHLQLTNAQVIDVVLDGQLDSGRYTSNMSKYALSALLALEARWMQISPIAVTFVHLENLERTEFSLYQVYCLQLLALIDDETVSKMLDDENFDGLRQMLEKSSLNTCLPRAMNVIEAESMLRNIYDQDSLKNDVDRFQVTSSNEQKQSILMAKLIHWFIDTHEVSEASRAHLGVCLLESHPYLTTISSEFINTRDSDTLFNAIYELSQSWRSQHAKLLTTLFSLGLEQRAANALELQVYFNAPVLLAAFDLYSEAMYTNENWLEFMDTVKRVLHSLGFTLSQAIEEEESRASVDAVIRQSLCMTMADTDYLRVALNEGNVILQAALAVYRDDSNMCELQSTLASIATSWRRSIDTCNLPDFLSRQILFEDPSAHQEMAEHLSTSHDIVSANEAAYFALQASQQNALCSHVAHLAGRPDMSDADVAFLKLVVVGVKYPDVKNVIHAALRVFEEAGDMDEFYDTLLCAGYSWRRRYEFSHNVCQVEMLTRQNVLSIDQLELVLLAILRGEANFQNHLDTEPRNTIMKVQRVLSDACERCANVIYDALIQKTLYLTDADLLHLRENLDSQDDVLVRLATKLMSGDINEFLHSVELLSRAWRSRNNMRAVLSLVYELDLSSVANAQAVIEVCAFHNDVSLLVATQLYYEGGTREDFRDTVSHIVQRETGDDKMTETGMIRACADVLGIRGKIDEAEHKFLCLCLSSSLPDLASNALDKYQHSGSVLLQVALQEYQRSSNAAEMFDTLLNIARRWKIHTDAIPAFENKSDTLVAYLLVLERGCKFEVTANDVVEEKRKRRQQMIKDISARAYSMQRENLISEADYHALLTLARKQNSVIEQTWVRSSCYDIDVTPELVQLAQCWRMPEAVDSVLELVSEMHLLGKVSKYDLKMVEMVLQRGEGADLFANLYESDVFEQIVRLVADDESNIQTRYLVHLANTIVNIVLSNETSWSVADAYALQYQLDTGNEALMAAASVFEDNGDEADLFDTCARIAQKWRRQTLSAQLLLLLNVLVTEKYLESTVVESVELLIFKRDHSTLNAFHSFILSNQSHTDKETLTAELMHFASQVSTPKQYPLISRNELRRETLLEKLEQFVNNNPALSSISSRFLRDLLQVESEEICSALGNDDKDEILRIAECWKMGTVWSDIDHTLMNLSQRCVLMEPELHAVLALTSQADELVLAAWHVLSQSLHDNMDNIAYAEFADTIKRIAYRKGLGNFQRLTPLDSFPIAIQQQFIEQSIHEANVSNLEVSLADMVFPMQLSSHYSVIFDAAFFEFVESGCLDEFVDTLNTIKLRTMSEAPTTIRGWNNFKLEGDSDDETLSEKLPNLEFCTDLKNEPPTNRYSVLSPAS